MTFAEFLAFIKANYGFSVFTFMALDPDGNEVEMKYAQNQDGLWCPLPALAPEDQLDEDLTASLCRQLKIPPTHLGLPDEEPASDDDLIDDDDD